MQHKKRVTKFQKKRSRVVMAYKPKKKKSHWFLKALIVSPFFLGSYFLAQMASETKTITFENHSMAENTEWDPCGLKDVYCENEKQPEPSYAIAEVTGYTASEEETDSDPNIAANNQPVFKGGAACPGWIKLGQKVEIEGMGIYTCNDRMNIRYRNGNYFDIYFEKKSEALAHGRKKMAFRVL